MSVNQTINYATKEEFGRGVAADVQRAIDELEKYKKLAVEHPEAVRALCVMFRHNSVPGTEIQGCEMVLATGRPAFIDGDFPILCDKLIERLTGRVED